MNRRFVRRVQSLGFVAIIATFALLITQPLMSQGPVAGRDLHKSATIFAPVQSAAHATPGAVSGAVGSASVDPGTPLFPPAVTYDTGSPGAIFYNDSNWVLVKDIDGDGKPDIIVANWCSVFSFNGCPSGTGTVGVLLGNGDGTFQPVVTYDTGDYFAISVFAVDVNGDGKLDLVVANGCLVPGYSLCSAGASVGVLMGNGDGTFQAVKNYATGEALTWLAIADVNRDGKPDLLVSTLDPNNAGKGSVGVLLGKGDGTFAPVQSYDSGGLSPDYIAVADLNGDGRPDLIVSNSFSCANCQGNMGVLLGKGDGTFYPVVNYASLPGVNIIDVVDLNNDGKLDLVVNAGGPFNGGEFAVLLGNGDGTFQPSTNYTSGGEYNTSILLIDLNGDHVLDFVTTNFYCTEAGDPSCVAVRMGNGDGTFQPIVEYDVTGVAGQVVAGDVNGDGKTDLLTVSQCGDKKCSQGSVDVLLGNGDGTFQPAISFDSGGKFTTWVGTADVNGDGNLDVIAVSPNDETKKVNGTVGVLINTTTGLPATTTTLGSSLNPSTYGQIVTFTAAVSAASGTPTGNVIFYDGSTSLGSVTLAGGSAAFSTSSLSPGSHSMTAAYQGSSSFAPSTSSVLTQVVNGTATTTSLVSSINPSNYGQSVTFTATVSSSAGTPTGTVLFYDGSTALFMATLNNGSAAFPTSSLSPGSHSMTAAYQGSGSFAPSTSDVLTQFVNGAATTTSLVSSLNPSNYGQSVTFTATVNSSAGTPTGSVVFYDGSNALGTVSLVSGSAALSTSSLSPGLHTITAAYQGSGSFGASTSAPLTQVVNSGTAPTTTSLTASPNPALPGQTVTYTAKVTSQNGQQLTGTIMFQDSGVTFATVAVSGNQAAYSISYKKHGNHSIIAIYSGDGNNQGSISPTLVEVVLKFAKEPYPTRTYLRVSGILMAGQTVTLDAAIGSQYGSGIPDGDQVEFFDGNGILGYATTEQSVASLPLTLGGAETINFHAVYMGDPMYRKSYAHIIVFVEKNPTTTSLVSSPNPAVYGQPVTYTATVTSPGPPPQGDVRITGVGRVPLVNGVATFTKPLVRAGTHAIKATYVGNSVSAMSTSPVLEEVVNPAPTTTALVSSLNPSSSGQTVTFTATVTSSTGVDPFGTVTFTAGTTTLGTVAVKDTQASISTATLPVGSTTITATYSGAASFIASSASLSQVVQP